MVVWLNIAAVGMVFMALGIARVCLWCVDQREEVDDTGDGVEDQQEKEVLNKYQEVGQT